MAKKAEIKYKRRLHSNHLSGTELRTIAFVATLFLAAIAILKGVESPVIYTFLGTAIGITLGHITK